MGQDRELTDEQKEFALTTVERFIEIWEKAEDNALNEQKDKMIKFIYPEENKEKQVQENTEMAGEVAQGVEEYEFKKGAKDAVYFDKKFPEPVEEGQEPP